MVLKTGKLPWNILWEFIKILPIEDIDLVMGPSFGEDSAVLRVKDGFLVVHTDPITAASRRAGWLAIHISANDVAVRGVKPKWFLITALLPPSYEYDDIREVFIDASRALKEVDGVVVGGHTEITPDLNRPILVVTSMGYTNSRVIYTRDAKPGDKVVIIGRVGGEGAGVLAWDFEKVLLDRGVDKNIVDKAKRFIEDVSVVNKALLIKDYVNTMHDPTEGGLIQGLREVAVASGVNIIVDLEKVFIDEVVDNVVKCFNLDPLRILSSGLLVTTVPRNKFEDLISIVEKENWSYSVIGEVVKGDGELILRTKGNIVEVINEDVIDEIYKLYSRNKDTPVYRV
ncbi:MAG: AIR synthase family protein [Desulfurococcaceae archaeon]